MNKKIEAREMGMPVPLAPKTRKQLGDMADVFDKVGDSSIQELITELKDVILKKLKAKKDELMDSLTKEFGVRGSEKANPYVNDWYIALTEEVLDGVDEEITNSIFSDSEEVPEENDEIEEEIEDEVELEASTKKTKAAKLLALAYKAHKKGLVETAKRIFTYAMNDSSVEELMSDIDEAVQEFKDEKVVENDEDNTELDLENIEIENDLDEEAPIESEELPVEPELPTESENEECENCVAEEDEKPVESEEEKKEELTEAQVKKVRALANRIASVEKGKHSDLAKQILEALKK